MRKAIREQLIAQVPAIGTRVFEPSMAGASTKKPYLVVKSEGDSGTNIRQGFDVPFEVWVYSDPTSFGELDELCDSVLWALHEIDLTTKDGQIFTLQYEGSTPDFYDEDWKALTRQLEFRTHRIIGG